MVSLIAAEDTRQTRVLLDHYHIKTPVTSYHEHSKRGRLEKVLLRLDEGDVALVSDAGTPALNDPGYELVSAAIERGHEVIPIPGPSAPVAALVASGLPTDSFLYLGYLPRKREQRRNALEEVAGLPYTLIFLEAPHRLVATLQDLHHVLGDRGIAVARELTKVHEEIIRGRVEDALEHFKVQPPRGEITLVVDGARRSKSPWSEERVYEALGEALAGGGSPTQIAGDITAQSGWPRREVYRMMTELKKGSKTLSTEKVDEPR